MSRSVEEIQKSMADAIDNADPTIESRSGPVYNIMLQPVSNEVSRIETEQDRINALYSLQFQEVATTEETNALAANFGLQRAPGSKASVVVYFFRFTRPQDPAVVRRGSLISNVDGTLQYIVQEDAVIDPSNAEAFFNAGRRTYEVAVNAVAVSPGDTYNIPAFRINTLVTANSDFDGVESRRTATGGSEEETQADEVTRVRQKFAGLNLGSINGISFVASNSFPEYVQDVAVVQPSNVLFDRAPTTPALDIYIAGNNNETVRQSYVALGGETQIALASTPAVAGSLVLTINGIVDTGAVIVLDTGVNAGSVRAQDIVLLGTAMSAGDVATFSYSFNRLVFDVQQGYEPSSVGDSLLFGTDILVFEAEVAPITIVMSIRVASSFDVPRTTDQVQNVISEYVNQNVFGITLFPEQLREQILTTVQGVTSLDLQEFRRTDRSLRDVEIIEMDDNEISSLDDESFQLNIR
jgi:hypothetical protein